jgi:hypothetical protein
MRTSAVKIVVATQLLKDTTDDTISSLWLTPSYSLRAYISLNTKYFLENKVQYSRAFQLMTIINASWIVLYFRKLSTSVTSKHSLIMIICYGSRPCVSCIGDTSGYFCSLAEGQAKCNICDAKKIECVTTVYVYPSFLR